MDSDAFLDMPTSSQNLYMHMLMRADDDGFVSNPKRISRMVGASDDDMKVLVGKRFVIPFESGVCVIKHWRIHNYIQKDRYQETKYIEEMALLSLKDNGAYTLDTECIHDGYTGKVSIGKDSIEIGKSKDSSLSFLESLPDDVLTSLGEKYHISPKGIQSKATDLLLYCRQKGKTYKDYKAFLENAIRKDKVQLQNLYPLAVKQQVQAEPELTPEQIEKNRVMRENISNMLKSKKL